ncbi:ribosomal protein S2, flavodoxin-like domain-containing protein [Flagelloscypha sp. PMI_526]|nr:ribosomal protein S2, flavodoxin-like domain-containing protein [Flagelloscypha sp. PMI_526]
MIPACRAHSVRRFSICRPRQSVVSSLDHKIKEHLVKAADYEPPPPLESPQHWEQFQSRRTQTKALLDLFSTYGSNQLPENTWSPRDGLLNPPDQTNLTLSALMAAGAHYGHASSRLQPNFLPYAYGTRAGITIIDLDQTMSHLRRAANVVRSVAADGGQILFVGTRPDLHPIVKRAAERMQGHGFYVADRWMPGILSNREAMFGDSELEQFQIEPDLVILLNPIQTPTAMKEFALFNIPTIGLIDTNVDPRIVLYPIPANDESTRTAELVAGVLSVAGREGVALYKERRTEHLEWSTYAEQMPEEDLDKLADDLQKEVDDIRASRKDAKLDIFKAAGVDIEEMKALMAENDLEINPDEYDESEEPDEDDGDYEVEEKEDEPVHRKEHETITQKPSSTPNP